ncbi:hypothetical protein [Belliella kenyensis]|nr:hypothetical protein [Belliella kenyensis]MCH7400852.1 hypothetical protein [Belliella kenyensis]
MTDLSKSYKELGIDHFKEVFDLLDEPVDYTLSLLQSFLTGVEERI